MAKEHVERDYAVVGSWEDTNITLTVLERYIPRFFRGAKLMYESRLITSLLSFSFVFLSDPFTVYQCITTRSRTGTRTSASPT